MKKIQNLLIILIFVILLLFEIHNLILIITYNNLIYKTNTWTETSATITMINYSLSNLNGRPNDSAYVEFQYIDNNNIMYTQYNSYSHFSHLNKKYHINDTFHLKYNPENHNEYIYIENIKTLKNEKLTLFIMILLFVFLLIIAFVKNNKKDNL